MATTAFKGHPVHTSGQLPALGSRPSPFSLVGTGLNTVSSTDLTGRRTVLNIFPSIDTGVCAASVRRFNELAAQLDNTEVVCVSMDLPFALARFCGDTGIDNVTTASAFRSTFGDDYGVRMLDGPLEGLLARAIVVIDEHGIVRHTQLVPEIATEPDYAAALAAMS
ncbi:MAG: lipid hydroperoxide peroxidase [Micrococcales bacterium]|nr:MAG: lipid hydroperoxide peroxidase [Micrococcales bacterium]